MRITAVEPTIFFVRPEGADPDDPLQQLVRVSLINDGATCEARLHLRADGAEYVVPLGVVPAGEAILDAWFPDLREPTEIWLGLETDGEIGDKRTMAWQPERHWEVHLVQYAHHDLGYTDLPSNVRAEYDGFMDDILRFCAETEEWAEDDARFRYQCEQAWSVVHYLENRPPEVAQRLAHYCQNGQLEVTALFGNQTLELCSHEELVRLLYPAFQLKRQLGIEISTAEHNDIPGFPWGLAGVLAGAGIRHFSPGVPFWYFGLGEDRVHPLWDTEEALPLAGVPSACWWEAPDGSRILLWLDRHGRSWQPYDYDQALAELPDMLRKAEASGYPYDLISYTLKGGMRDNAPPTVRYAYLAREWNRRWAYPRLINTTNRPFLEEFEARCGDTLKTLRGDVPGTDYPTAATCTPKETAVDRQAHEWLMTAEKLASWAALTGEVSYPGEALGHAYRQVFYYDLHCWGMSHPGGPAQDGHWSEKAAFAYRAAALAHDLMIKTANALTDQVAYPEKGHYITVFNPLSHKRTDVARIQAYPWEPCGTPMYWELPEGQGRWPRHRSGSALGRKTVKPPVSLLERPFEVVDAETGEAVPYQVVTLDDPGAAVRWAPERAALGKVDSRHLHAIALAADALPAMGLKSYRIAPCEQWPVFKAPVASEESDQAYTIENPFYRLEVDLDEGGIVSLFDKELSRELVDGQADHPFGALIVRDSETGQEELLRFSEVSEVTSGPLFTTLRLRGDVSCCPRVVVEIALYHTTKRVELAARILRDSTPMRELYFAFPFQVPSPRFRFEGTGSVIEPLRDQWPGSNTDYYAVQHWADVSSEAAANDAWGITWSPLDTPMTEFGGLWPGYISGAHHGVPGPGYGHAFLQPGELKHGHIYALVSVNNFRTNFINAHPDEYVVRYAFTSHAGDWQAAHAWEFGWGAHNPPLPIWMQGPSEGQLPPTTSFCQVDADNVLVTTIKRAEDGDGYIIRLMETAGQETTVTVTTPLWPILHAFETNLVEENQRLLQALTHAVQIDLPAFGLRTLRIKARL
jgi:hypothetical protein